MYNIIISISSQSYARVSPSPQELEIYSDMEAINIMAMVMETIIDEQYLYKSTTSTEITTRSRQDVDGMDGDGGDAAVDGEDRCLSLPDLRRVKMDPWWMSSPYRCLLEVRFLRFLVFCMSSLRTNCTG